MKYKQNKCKRGKVSLLELSIIGAFPPFGYLELFAIYPSVLNKIVLNTVRYRFRDRPEILRNKKGVHGLTPNAKRANKPTRTVTNITVLIGRVSLIFFFFKFVAHVS